MRRQGCQTVSNTGLCLDPSKISSSEGMASKPASLSLLSTQSSGFGIPLGIPIPSTYMYFFNDGNAIWNRLCTMSWMREPEEPDDGPPKHVSLCPSHIRPGVSDKRLACGVGPRYGSMERLRQPDKRTSVCRVLNASDSARHLDRPGKTCGVGKGFKPSP